MTDVPSSPLVLVVCTANVCRSPLVESVLRRSLPGAPGPLTGVEVASAGVRAVPGQPMCAVSAASAGDEAFARTHRSRPVDAELARSAALVLTAEREHRGAVARLAPGMQSRIFTLEEAAALAGIAERRVAAGEAERPADLDALVALLHSSRGRIPLPQPEPQRGLFRRRRPAPTADPLDLPDGHGQEPAVHAAAAARTHALADRVAAALAALSRS